MNLTESKYTRYSLTREMMETPGIIKNFDPSSAHSFGSQIRDKKGLFIAGEGSSRIFPAKRMIYDLYHRGLDFKIFTEGSTQAMEYNLDAYSVFGASNSGQTAELIRLFEKLKNEGHNKRFGITANINTRLQKIADDTHILNCGKEDAVAATKSVFEQALFYDALLHYLEGDQMQGLNKLSNQVSDALTLNIEDNISDILSQANIIYFAGRNTGVAEELTLKTNEIVRKKAMFLEGTYALHGIEEIMDSNDVVVLISPFPEELENYDLRLAKGVGLNIIAVSTYPTQFPTILIPEGKEYREYIELAAGWNLLIESGIKLGIDLDKPVRARKIGNEVAGS